MASKKKAVKKKVEKKTPPSVHLSKMSIPPHRASKKMKTRKTKPPIGTCFVLMPFKEPFETYYRVIIKPAISGANLDVKRGDSLFTPTPIMGDVWHMIQDAKVLVAELTEKNANVFYELGLAHAIGKSVILISETMDDVPFDLQQLRVILYDKNDPAWGNKLKTSLTNALQETVHSPVDAVPPMFRKKVKSQAPADSEMSLRILDLERRIASLSTQRGSHIESNIVEWADVDRYLSQWKPTKDLSEQFFANRADAVAWTISKIRAGVPISKVRAKLIEILRSKNEVDTVFGLAAARV